MPFKLLIPIVISMTVIVSMGGCTPNLASKADLKTANFSIQKTTKKDVVHFLGLPESITRGADGLETFYYPGDAKLSGFIVSSGGSVRFAPPGPLDSAIGDSKVGDGATFTFSTDGILITEDSPRTRAIQNQSQDSR